MTRLGRDFSYTMQREAVPPVSADVIFASSRFPNYKIGANNQILEVKENAKLASLKDVVANENALLLEQKKRLSVRDLASKFEKGLAAAAKLSDEAKLRDVASLEKHVLLKKLRDALESLRGRVVGKNKDDVEEAIAMVEALAVQLTQREGELIQEKAEVKKLASFLKQASVLGQKHPEMLARMIILDRTEQAMIPLSCIRFECAYNRSEYKINGFGSCIARISMELWQHWKGLKGNLTCEDLREGAYEVLEYLEDEIAAIFGENWQRTANVLGPVEALNYFRLKLEKWATYFVQQRDARTRGWADKGLEIANLMLITQWLLKAKENDRKLAPVMDKVILTKACIREGLMMYLGLTALQVQKDKDLKKCVTRYCSILCNNEVDALTALHRYLQSFHKRPIDSLDKYNSAAYNEFLNFCNSKEDSQQVERMARAEQRLIQAVSLVFKSFSHPADKKSVPCLPACPKISGREYFRTNDQFYEFRRIWHNLPNMTNVPRLLSFEAEDGVGGWDETLATYFCGMDALIRDTILEVFDIKETVEGERKVITAEEVIRMLDAEEAAEIAAKAVGPKATITEIPADAEPSFTMGTDAEQEEIPKQRNEPPPGSSGFKFNSSSFNFKQGAKIFTEAVEAIVEPKLDELKQSIEAKVDHLAENLQATLAAQQAENQKMMAAQHAENQKLIAAQQEENSVLTKTLMDMLNKLSGSS